MVLTLYGFPPSTCTQTVATVLREKKVTFKFVEVDMRKGDHKSVEHLKRALFEQAASVESANFNPYASGLAFEKVFKQFRNLAPDEAQVKKHVDTLSTKLDVYEQILSKQKYIAGDQITLVDLFHLPYGAKLYPAGYGDLIDSRPNVKRWFNELTSRQSWQAVKDGVKV